MFLQSSHFKSSSYPSILAPLYNTSIDLLTLSKLSFASGSNVSASSSSCVSMVGKTGGWFLDLEGRRCKNGRRDLPERFYEK